jgi:hypothetical protein
VQTKTIPLQPWTNPLGLQEAEVPKMSWKSAEEGVEFVWP